MIRILFVVVKCVFLANLLKWGTSPILSKLSYKNLLMNMGLITKKYLLRLQNWLRQLYIKNAFLLWPFEGNLFIRRSSRGIIIVLLYVDDMVLVVIKKELMSLNGFFLIPFKWRILGLLLISLVKKYHPPQLASFLHNAST